MMKMLEKDAGAGELLLGIIMAAIGIAVQAAPFMRGKDWEAALFHRRPKRRDQGFQPEEKESGKENQGYSCKKDRGSGTNNKKRKSLQKSTEEVQPDMEIREELQKTQEYAVGQKQYEKPKPSQSLYPVSGIGIDLDDLNRELSQEIQKIYQDEQQE